jgi:hypothetical protein
LVSSEHEAVWILAVIWYLVSYYIQNSFGSVVIINQICFSNKPQRRQRLAPYLAKISIYMISACTTIFIYYIHYHTFINYQLFIVFFNFSVSVFRNMFESFCLSSHVSVYHSCNYCYFNISLFQTLAVFNMEISSLILYEVM